MWRHLHSEYVQIWQARIYQEIFCNTRNYGEAVLKAVNLGDDTDTTGAVTGAMAGLHYGLKDIPQDWLDKLAKREFIRDIAIKMPRWDLLPSA